ncbi:MAG: Gfo/Idh/MocA family oxidoreductase [Thermodesulfobacteriota bacterium]
MKTTKLQVGVIGLGVGEKHVEAFQSHPACTVVKACDLDEGKLAAFSAKHPGIGLCRDDEEILTDPEVDVVSVASFDDHHYDQVAEAIRHGKHVMVEKPVCLYRDEAVEIKRLLKANPSIRLSSNLNLRTAPRFRRLREAVRSGELGRIFHMEGDYLWGRVRKLTEGWRGEMEFYSIIYGASVHMIDLLMWVAVMRPVEVQGVGNSIATRASGFRFNDFAAVLMRSEDGLTAKVCGCGGCVHPHFHRVAVFGTEGTFLHETSGAKMYRQGEAGPVETEITDPYPAPERKGEVITSFVDSILEPMRHRPLVSIEDVFAVMSVCFAAEEAVLKKAPVPVNYI